MSRIRNIKPDFLRHEGLQDLEAANPGKHPMLVFAGLWTQSSRNGVFPWKPRTLKLDILPFLNYDMDETLAILWKEGYIQKFTACGADFGYIATFQEHQAFSHKELLAPPKYPDFNPKGEIKYPGATPAQPEHAPGSDPEQSRDRAGSVPAPADIGHRTKDIGLRTRESAHDPEQALGSETWREPPVTPPEIIKFSQALADPIKKAFNYLNPQGYTAPAIENIGIEGLAEKFYRLGGQEPGKFALAVIEKYTELTMSKDKFWKGQPLTPSNLNKPGIFDRVIAELRAQHTSAAHRADAWAQAEEAVR